MPGFPRCKDPLWCSVTACGAVKDSLGTRIGLVKKRDEVVLYSDLLIHVEPELPIHGLQLVTYLIHMTTQLQFSPTVKSITCDFLCISLIRFRSSKGGITELLNQDGVHSTDEYIDIREPSGDRFIVSSRVLHADLRLAI